MRLPATGRVPEPRLCLPSRFDLHALTAQPHPQGAFLTIFDNFTEQALKPNLLWIFALEQNRYMATYGITVEEIARVSVKNKRNALDHPAAQLGDLGRVVREVLVHRDSRAVERLEEVAELLGRREPRDLQLLGLGAHVRHAVGEELVHVLGVAPERCR